MRKLFFIAAISGCSIFAHAQMKEISRNWVSFERSLDASFLKRKVKFKVTASVKVATTDSLAKAALWVTVANKSGEAGFFDNMNDRPIRSNEWKTYAIEGIMDESAEQITFGGLCQYNGQFYFDDFQLFVENDSGTFEKVNFENSGFEEPVLNNQIPHWKGAVRQGREFKVKEFEFLPGMIHSEGKISLLVEGKGARVDSVNFIGPRAGYSPQIGTMIAMLNNLSNRVEKAVEVLSQKETDHLLDDKANSIGALVMHLAAAEAYYQVFTFEKRGFNEEEKKKWQLALDLGTEARKTFRGHDIEYYLNIYKAVRQKTIEELAKRDDAWLAETQMGYGINNHFCWFHVMEHQSSHLGQILLLKKRLPKEKDQLKAEVSSTH